MFFIRNISTVFFYICMLRSSNEFSIKKNWDGTIWLLFFFQGLHGSWTIVTTTIFFLHKEELNKSKCTTSSENKICWKMLFISFNLQQRLHVQRKEMTVMGMLAWELTKENGIKQGS